MRAGRTSFMRSARAHIVGWLAIAGLIALAALHAYDWSERSGFSRLDDIAGHHLDLRVAALESELGKHASLPGLLELDSSIELLLRHPERAPLREAVSRRLTGVNVRAAAGGIVVLDTHGVVLAASDWYRGSSTLGRNLIAGIDVAEATSSGHGFFFGADVRSGASGYYFAHPYRRGGQILGAVAFKIDLAPIEALWMASTLRSSEERVLVVDEYGVVVLSSNPLWKFKVMPPMRTSGARPWTDRARPVSSANVLAIAEERRLDHGAQLVRLPAAAHGDPSTYFLQERSIPRLGWRLFVLLDPGSVRQQARFAAVAAGTLVAFMGLLAHYLLQRRRGLAKLLAARQALQQAYDELEHKVQERTVELQDANQELLREVQERKRAEEVLRQAQDELVQATKLALLGQLSVGISHEINQPLTALRALSQNTRLLLERGRTDEAAKNLAAIAALTERMGRITAQLKAFARKTGSHQQSRVSLNTAIANARTLLQNRIREENIELRIDVAAQHDLRLDGNRLEQVLINLFSNAMDAMKTTPTKILSVQARPIEGRMSIRVEDTGVGIPPAVASRLFEPFFTTKPPGEGLGLGLVISANIVKEFGGSLRLSSAERVGSAFEFDVCIAEG